MNATIMKNRLFEKFSESAIRMTVFDFTNRTSNIDEMTDQELEKLYNTFFPKQPSLVEQVVLAEHRELLRKNRSIVLKIATKIGLKHPDNFDKFNAWMLKSSILKKRLNDYSLTELQSLQRQLRSAESNFEASATKPGNQAWYQKHHVPIPSKS